MTHLAGLGVPDGDEADVVDVGVRKIVARGAQRDVELARQVGQLRVALAVVCVHGVDVCGGGGNTSVSKEPSNCQTTGRAARRPVYQVHSRGPARWPTPLSTCRAGR